MKMCEYEFVNGEKCKEETLPKEKYCILHFNFSEEERSEEFKKIAKLKEEAVKEKVNKKDFNFEGARLVKVDFSGMEIEGDVNFINAGIGKYDWSEEGSGDISLDKAKINGNVLFGGAMVVGNVSFEESQIDGCVRFDGITTGWDIRFYKAKIKGEIIVANSEIGRGPFGGDIIFNEAEMSKGFMFVKSKITGNVRFEDAIIGGEFAGFENVQMTGSLLFRGAKFLDPWAQEQVCRSAKGILASLGDRGEADYHFYREMEAKRRQKHPLIRFLELPLQYIFGYGTYWWGVLITWFLVVFGSAFLFWIGNGVKGANSLWECIYFSIVTATTLGSGDYHPTHGIYQGLASFEATFGTFMWAAFIAIFARKYMR